MARPARRRAAAGPGAAAAARRGAALCSLAAAAALLLQRPLPAYAAGRAPTAAAQRRGALAAVAAATAWPAVAARAEVPPPPRALEISGFEGRRADVNGRWSCISTPCGGSTDPSRRAVYKKDAQQELYFMVNDCGQVQVQTRVTGECNGFAKQEGRGRWLVDGATVEGKVRVRPAIVLAKGDKVEVVQDFSSDDEEPTARARRRKGQIKLSQGMSGVVEEIDSDGDAAIRFDKFGTVFIYTEKWGNMKKL